MLPESQRMTEIGSCFILPTEPLRKGHGATAHARNRGRMKCGRKRETGQKRGIRKNDGKDCDRNTGNESTDSHDCRFVCKKKTPGCRICKGIHGKRRAVHFIRKRRWITTHSSSRAMPDGSLLRSTRTRESVALEQEKRDGFNEMIDDAMSGSIDLIITKSVSRFARNTVDSLVTIRKLKEKRRRGLF